jgi:hypothetical protein
VSARVFSFFFSFKKEKQKISDLAAASEIPKKRETQRGGAVNNPRIFKK